VPFVTGETLRQVMRRERTLPIDRAVRVATEVLDALGHAMTTDSAHRDIKPDNIVLSEEGGGAILVDFGIARAIATSGEDRVTRSGFVVGTEEYMSPEQRAGSPDIRRQDRRLFAWRRAVRSARRSAARSPPRARRRCSTCSSTPHRRIFGNCGATCHATSAMPS